MNDTVTKDITNRLLNRYAAAEGIESDYAIAKRLGCSYATVHNYRNYKTKMDATTAVQIAERLRINPIEVIAAVELERSVTARKQGVWEKYRGRILLAASLALIPIWGQICAKSGIEDATAYTLYALICAKLRKGFLRYRPKFRRIEKPVEARSLADPTTGMPGFA